MKNAVKEHHIDFGANTRYFREIGQELKKIVLHRTVRENGPLVRL